MPIAYPTKTRPFCQWEHIREAVCPCGRHFQTAVRQRDGVPDLCCACRERDKRSKAAKRGAEWRRKHEGK